jgi:hypothetical protein
MRVYGKAEVWTYARMLATVMTPTSLKIKQQVLPTETSVIFRQIRRIDVDCIHGHHVTTMRNSHFTLGQCFNFEIWKYTAMAII